MTETKAKPAQRRRLLAGVLVVMLIMTAWIGYFLFSFDLNDYRRQAEERLSALLSLPVTIGDIRYNLHDANLAMRLADVRIGDERSALQVDAESIMADLQWWGLLNRDVRVAKVSLVRPRVRYRTTSGEQAGDHRAQGTDPAPFNIDPALLHQSSIGKLEIHAGELRIDVNPPGTAPGQIEVTGLDGEFANLRLGSPMQLTVKWDLRLPGQQTWSAWQLEGESSLDLSAGSGLTPHFDLGLKGQDFDLQALDAALSGQLDQSSITGLGDLHLHILGTPESGVDFNAGVSSDRIALHPGPAYQAPIVFQSLLASGHLQTHGEQPGISNLALQLDESRLAGRLAWTPAGQPLVATATLASSELPITRIKSWLPTSEFPWQMLQQKLLNQGSVQVERAEVTLFEDAASHKRWRIDQLKGELRQAAWVPGDAPAIELAAVPFDLAGNQWQINHALGSLGPLRLSADGTGTYDGESLVVTALDFSGTILASGLPASWQPAPGLLDDSSRVDMQGHLEGPLDRLHLDLEADLTQLGIIPPRGVRLSPSPEDKLAVHATISPEEIRLEHGTINWSAAKGRLSGSFRPGAPDSLLLDAMLSVDDLAKVASVVPFLERLQLRGQADVSITQKGLPRDSPPQVVLTLRDAGLRATKHIADLNQINGRVHVTPKGLRAENLRAHVGQSPATVQVRLDDFSDPHLMLEVTSPAIRASDLVFHSDKALLRDIKGHLEIDGDGLTFAPVDVRLDGGTQARVRGTISFLPPYQVLLDITSDFANIGEVIGLWANRPAGRQEPAETEATAPGDAETTIRITATAKRGDLYGMSFHDASGVIIPSRERLSIHPLDFSVGEGFCNVQVLVDFFSDAPSRLRVSGHAEAVDALEVYRELLNQKNIVRGKLRGDFHLVGEIGANYLPSSYGHFSVRVENGVLHQFQVLSKVFSLLNVSQIFALKLPDMDQEGMPFSSLSANFLLDKGVLSSKDLHIQSEAMNQSYTGQMNLITKEIDLALAIHPLGTVDKIVSRIPVAGWLLTGDDRALLTAHFAVTGTTDNVSVESMPLDTLSEPTIGLLMRTLGLPFKLMEDPQILWGGESSQK